MYQATFGTRNQVQFNNEQEYYELLGYLAKSDRTTSLVWEHNEEQGVWGSEGRIQFNTANRPYAVTLPHTAGVGNIVSRVNCNEFVRNLNEDHNFAYGGMQDEEAIRETIPEEYLADFERGLSL